MANTNKINKQMSDKAIIVSIGAFIKQQRLAQNKTQIKTAEIAGVNRSTLSQIENGEPISLISLIQILRTLDLLHVLGEFKTNTQISPLTLAKMDKKKRKRARGKNNDNNQIESEW